MNDQDKIQEPLVAELAKLRQRLADQRRIEQERDRSHAILNAAMECLPFALFAIGPDGRYMLVNAAGKNAYGNIVGKTPEQVCPNEYDLAVWLENNRRAFAGETVADEVELTVHGENRHYYNVITPVRDATEFYGILGVNVDITSRVQAEKALAAAHEFNDRLVESMLDGVSVLNSEGVHVEVNDALCRMTGFSREELVGAGIPHPYWPPEQQAVLNEAFNRTRAGNADGLELVFMRRDGERFPVIVAPSKVQDRDGAVVCYIATVKDITERKQAEMALKQANETLERRVEERTQAMRRANEQLHHEIGERRRVEESLRQSEKRFRNYFEQGLIGMAATSVAKRWLEVNDRLCEILGHPREELLQTTWAELTHPEDLPADSEQFEQLLAGKIGHYTMDKRFVRGDGTIAYTTILIRPFFSDDGSIHHIVVLMQDITARKHAQEALEHERRTLRHMLQASDHERQLIAYDVHDGLAQHLAAAIMQFQMHEHLRQQSPSRATKAYDAGIGMVQQAHCEARRLISGVRPPALDESGVTIAIAHLVHEHSRQKELEIEYQHDVAFDRLPPILENAIYRIAQEALANACQHSQSRQVKVSLVQEGDQVHLEVQDSGTGFDPESVAENRFGLAGIRERARLLGGKCWIDSEPGKGTSVRVVLPVWEQE